jgi:hypothetical protein
MNDYEVARAARIAENKRRLVELGIVETTRQLAETLNEPAKRPKIHRKRESLGAYPLEIRRSSRCVAPHLTTASHLTSFDVE